MLFFSKKVRTESMLPGRIEKRILEPSSGGIGMRLNVASTRFIFIIVTITKIGTNTMYPAGNTNRSKSPKIRAMMMFVAGPAKATIASPQRWLRRLYGLYGTGFAQPIMKPPKK